MSRTAIVTGAASGIGEAIAEALAGAGYAVVAADMNSEQGAAVAERIGAHFVHSDLAERASCRDLMDTALDRFDSVDILVNNAGFQHVAPLHEFPEDTWDRMQSVMLTAPFLLTKYAWPSMANGGWGRVVNIASVHALVASPNKAAYVSAKHGLLGLTRTTALEGGPHGITCNALCPSFVRTPLLENQIDDLASTSGIAAEDIPEQMLLKKTAIGKLLEPSEVADVVVFLCSDKGAHVTGAAWTIDCGWTAQ